MDETRPFPAPGGPVSGPLGGRYRLGAVLGRGGMADVLRAKDTLLGRDVAIKLFRPEVASAADQRGHSAEIRALAGLRHPGLVTLFDAGTDAAGTPGERPFLVMELVDGPSLAHRLTEGPLPPEVVADLGAQLADTLAYVHSTGVVHRDVKPANILLDDVPGRPGAPAAKLTDFGVARMIDTTRLTQVGMTVGTANYLSPEQALGHDVDGATDVYALGLVLLECLTGKVAFAGTGVAAASARLHRDPQVPPGLDASLGQLLTAMTRRDPAERPSAAEVAAGLSQTARLPAATALLPARPREAAPLAAATPGLTEAETTVLPSRPRPRRLLWAGLAALLVVLVAAVALLVDSSFGAGGGTGDRPTAPLTTSRVAPSTPTPSTAATSPAPTPTPKPSPPRRPAKGNGHSHEDGKGKHKGG